MAEAKTPPDDDAQESTEKEQPPVGFHFTSFREFLKFVEYAGNSAPIEFAEPVLDTAGAILIQKSLHFRGSLEKNLWKFFNQGNLSEKFTIADTKPLRSALIHKICQSLFKCLESGRFHVAQTLVDVSQINIRAMVTNIIGRRDVLSLFLRLDQNEDPILPHLGEVALVAGGFAEQYFAHKDESKSARETVRIAIFAGLFHDIALADDDDFLLNDIEAVRESRHAEKSAKLTKSLLPGIDAAVTDIIEHHHRDTAQYNPEIVSEINPQGVALEAVALSEYIFVQLRSQYRKDDKMNSAELLFYDLGRAFGQGRFHPKFRSIAARLWESLYATLYYGYQIGLVENRCPYKPSAIAYPTPRCTQVMCHADVTACVNYVPQFPLEILQNTRFPGRPGVYIQPGKYAKCKLADQLPKNIEEPKGATKWMEKGRVEKPEASG